MVVGALLGVLFAVSMVWGLHYMSSSSYNRDEVTHMNVFRDLDRRTNVAKVVSISMFILGTIVTLVIKDPAAFGMYTTTVCICLLCVAGWMLIRR